MSENRKTSRKTALPVGEILNSSSKTLGKLISHARHLQYLNQQITALLDSGIRDLVQVAAIHEQCLVLVTPSAALATRLRMDSNSLLRSLSAAGVKGFSKLKIRTAPLPHNHIIPKRKRQLPEIARQSLEGFAGFKDGKLPLRGKKN